MLKLVFDNGDSLTIDKKDITKFNVNKVVRKTFNTSHLSPTKELTFDVLEDFEIRFNLKNKIIDFYVSGEMYSYDRLKLRDIEIIWINDEEYLVPDMKLRIEDSEVIISKRLV